MAGGARSPSGAGRDLVEEALRATAPGSPFVGLDGGARFGDESWGPLASLDARRVPMRRGPVRFPPALAARIARRRAAGGEGGTGIAVVLSYDPDRPGAGACGDLAVEVDAALVPGSGALRVAVRPGAAAESVRRRWRDRVGRRLEREGPSRPRPDGAPAPVAATTSLPREAFLRSARSVLHHLREGDIYQANLTQRFRCPAAESAEGLFRRLRESAPAPRAALVRAGGRALVSVSPETFVDIAPDGFARTVPIKGTRPRGADPAADAAAVADLESSAKDRAELLMIVDLERNDLGRVSETGSVSVPELMAVRTYPAIHHLVATVTSRLRPGVGPQEWLAAVFPGGSVTGAPKRRAMEILASLEPVPRGWYTGALIWFDDDGWTRSSILIRSVVTHRGVAYVGSGGGIVVDSDPEAEWLEANHKARPLARALGFEPEEAR